MRTLRLILLALVLMALDSVHAMGPRQKPEFKLQTRNFSPGFQWCVATAAHQIEGGNIHSDWWRFESEPGNIKNGDKSGLADDHWNRLEEDVSLLKELHVKTYRFSIEWAKIEPQEGHWDFVALQHYQREIELLQTNGITPMVTLLHFTLPAWFADHGGWEWDGAPAAFERYVEFLYRGLGSGIRDWITFNEPMVAAAAGYFSGVFPPKKKNDFPATVRAILGILKSHARAYHLIHHWSASVSPGLQVRVGFAHHLRIMEPHWRFNPFEIWAAKKVDEIWNWSFAEAPETGRFKIEIPFLGSADEKLPELQGTQDFLGVNYYSRDIIELSTEFPFFKQRVNEDAVSRSELGWEIYPEGMYKILKSISAKFPGKPIIITENGIADSTDSQRTQFVLDHLKEVLHAIQEGVPVEGYCHWSLMDNFEWADGFGPRFGLFSVDYTTQKRVARPSAQVFSKICETNRLPEF